MRRQRRSSQGPPTKAYRERTLRRRNAARGVAGKQDMPSYFADRPLEQASAVRAESEYGRGLSVRCSSSRRSDDVPRRDIRSTGVERYLEIPGGRRSWCNPTVLLAQPFTGRSPPLAYDRGASRPWTTGRGAHAAAATIVSGGTGKTRLRACGGVSPEAWESLYPGDWCQSPH